MLTFHKKAWLRHYEGQALSTLFLPLPPAKALIQKVFLNEVGVSENPYSSFFYLIQSSQ